MLHENKVVIAQHRIPDETTETTQLKELPEPVDLEGAVVTADAAHAQLAVLVHLRAALLQRGTQPVDDLLPVSVRGPHVLPIVHDASA